MPIDRTELLFIFVREIVMKSFAGKASTVLAVWFCLSLSTASSLGVTPSPVKLAKSFEGVWIATKVRSSLIVNCQSGGAYGAYAFNFNWQLTRVGNSLKGTRTFKTADEVSNNFGGNIPVSIAKKLAGQLRQYLTLTLSDDGEKIHLLMQIDTFQTRASNGKQTGEFRIVPKNPASSQENELIRYQAKEAGIFKAGELISIMNKAAEKSWSFNPDSGKYDGGRRPLPKGGSHDAMGINCAHHFREIMRQIQSQGVSVRPEWVDEKDPTTKVNNNANNIVANIANSQEWEKVDEPLVQEFANRGILVVGISTGPTHGHIAEVFPIPEEVNHPDCSSGRGPFIRDGNEHINHDRLYASSWGAVRASQAFNYGRRPPNWYVWRPSKK